MSHHLLNRDSISKIKLGDILLNVGAAVFFIFVIVTAGR